MLYQSHHCLDPSRVQCLTGYFGSGAVLLALALGADRVIAAGRNTVTLERLADIDGARVVPVVMSGDVEHDERALRDTCEGGADIAFDIVGRANSANGTLASLKAPAARRSHGSDG